MKVHRAQTILLYLSLLTACGGGGLGPGVGGSTASLRSIQVLPSAPSVALGQNQQFTAAGHYSDGSSKDISASVVWASSNTSIGTISGSGFAKSLAAGSTTISAKLSGVAGYGTLTVTNTTRTTTLVSITITPANPDIILGTLQQFTATGHYSDGTSKDITASVTWGSSDDTVASINGGGMATALALGSLTISATSSSVTGSTTVNVQPATLIAIKIRPAHAKIATLTAQQFSAVGFYTDGSIRPTGGKASWTSSDTSVATIRPQSGLAVARSPGNTTITATLGSLTASATLEVTNATIVRISVGPPKQTIYQATKLPFTAIGLFSDHTTQNITIGPNTMWNSDNPAVAKIGNTGVAIALAPGTANISATFDGVSGSTPLYVSPATISSISVTPVTALLAPTTSVNCRATARFSDGSTLVITNFATWSSSASTVASVSPYGAVSALSGGVATITAQFGSVSGESSITVDSTPLTSIQISPPTASIAQQTGVQLRAIGTFADGNTQDLTNFALWTSSAPSVATINGGFSSGVAPGTATIVAVFGGQAGTADLTVTSATAASQVVSPFPVHFKQAGFTQSTVLADFSAGTTPVSGRNGAAVLNGYGRTVPPQGPNHALP